MRYRSPAPIILGCVMFAAGWVVTLGGQYSLTVNEDRLINAQNEPQNWLLMNGDYGSLRYSQLTQIKRRKSSYDLGVSTRRDAGCWSERSGI